MSFAFSLRRLKVEVFTIWKRCFLYLVNYARVKPDIAVKALPILINVG